MTLGLSSASENPKPTSSDTLLQQGHNYYNKAIPPNSATPYESVGAVLIQTTISMLLHSCSEMHVQSVDQCLVNQRNSTKASAAISTL